MEYMKQENRGIKAREERNKVKKDNDKGQERKKWRRKKKIWGMRRDESLQE